MAKELNEKYVFCAREGKEGYFEEEGRTVLFITPKEYWEDHGYMYDLCSPRYIQDMLEQYGFLEDMEGTYFGDLSVEEITTKLKAHPEFEYDEEFEKFLEDKE